jgi:hypothetical protein
MPERTEATSPLTGAGLCASCVHARRVSSDRGSIFIRCDYATIDRAYPKYPRLPMLACAAYRAATGDRSAT